MSGSTYYREHVGPWVRRRLTGTSSGDGREPKHPDVGDVDRAAQRVSTSLRTE